MKNWAIDQVYTARTTRELGDKGEQSGIFKLPFLDTASVDENGIVGDIQADKHVHGGPEKALHQYAVASYLLMRQAFPKLAGKFVAGSMGENISAQGMHEHNVHVGDIYRIGGVKVQVSQPRQPCWKINSKFDDSKLVKFISKTHINGWYYRVLEGGELQAADRIELLERPNDMSVYNFLRIYGEQRPAKHDLKRLVDCKGLNPAWQIKLQERFDYLYG
ncbi:MAG: MOSC domain-containing protein [Thiolinea sp.]